MTSIKSRCLVGSSLGLWVIRIMTCLLTGEVAFQGSCIMTGVTWKMMCTLEGCVQHLEKDIYKHEIDLNGKEIARNSLFVLNFSVPYLDHESLMKEMEADISSLMYHNYCLKERVAILEGGAERSLHGSEVGFPCPQIEGECGTLYAWASH